MNALRTIYRYWISILALAVIVQIAFAGYGAFYAANKVSDTTHQRGHVQRRLRPARRRSAT